MITIVDYGMGNLGSVANMIRKVGGEAQITGDIDTISNATKLILPGVGAFDGAMNRLHDQNLVDVLNKKALEDKIPVLGICLGMQLLTDGSDEGKRPGLGWIPGRAHSFKKAFQEKGISEEYLVPHMGWNSVRIQNNCALTTDFYDEMRFYFVHSFYVKADNPENKMLEATHGISFDAALVRDNIYGMQFHPEKSHKFGFKVFQSFLNA